MSRLLTAPPRQTLSTRVARASGSRRRANRLRRSDSVRAVYDALADLFAVPAKALADDRVLLAELDVDLLMDVSLVVEDVCRMTFTEAQLSQMACIADVIRCACDSVPAGHDECCR